VRGLIDAAGRLADGDYSARVSPSGSSSSRRVVASFNEMARRLETADEQRRRLLADLGHELRTPLTVVRGEIEAIVDGVHKPDAEQLQMLLDEVSVMERLLEDLRTLSLAEAGALELHAEPTDLVALVSDAVESHRRTAADQAVAVVVDGSPRLGDVLVDPVRIREVVSNLVVNALRAMPDGGALRVRVDAVAADAVIEVKDTGFGIDPADLDNVFDRFSKGSSSAGSGLGLTISRDLVEAHGGSITIESVPAVGTKVVVHLPRSRL
jgi:two-component system sensor histidine kinase BaeS